MLASLSTIASHRAVIVKMPGAKKAGARGFPVEFCAEPPPDALESVASSLAAAAEVSGKGSAEFAKGFARNMAPLFVRSQGVQLYRDGMFNNCQSFLNRIRDEQQYIEYSRELLYVAREIILEEVKRTNTQLTADIGPTPAAQAPPPPRLGTAAVPHQDAGD
jgi:hypothetical protein